MRTLVPAGAAALALAAGVADAAEWTIGGFAAQTVEASDNRGLDASELAGNPEVDFITDLGASFIGATPRSRFLLAPGARAFFSTEESFDARNVLPRFNGAYSRAGARLDAEAFLSAVPRLVSDLALIFVDGDIDETLVDVEEDVVAVDVDFGLDLDWRASPRDVLSLGLAFDAVEYLEDVEALDATRGYGASLGWSRTLTPRTQLFASPSTRLFRSDGDGDGGQSVSLPVGVTHQVNGRLTTSASAGPSYILREEADSTFGFVADLDLAYAGERTRLGFSLAQTIDQDATGDIDNRSRASAFAVRRIDPRQAVSLRAALASDLSPFSAGGEREEDFALSVEPSWRIGLTEAWSLNAGYRLVARKDVDRFRAANAVFLTVSRGLSFLP